MLPCSTSTQHRQGVQFLNKLSFVDHLLSLHTRNLYVSIVGYIEGWIREGYYRRTNNFELSFKMPLPALWWSRDLDVLIIHCTLVAGQLDSLVFLLFLHLTFPSQSSQCFPHPLHPSLHPRPIVCDAGEFSWLHPYSQTQQFSIFACCSFSKCSAWTGSTLSKRQLVEQKDFFLCFVLFLAL